MESIWLKVVSQSISVSIVILAVLLVRGIVMRKLPKKYAFFLWAVVGIRLLLPVGITSSIDLFQIVSNTIEQWNEENAENEKGIAVKVSPETLQIPEQSSGKKSEIFSGSISSVIEHQETMKQNEEEDQGNLKQNEEQSVTPAEDLFLTKIIQLFTKIDQLISSRKFIHATAYVWLSGIFVFWAWNLLSWLKVKKQLQYAVLYEDNIYECDKIGSPFVMGLIRPRIYIPFRLREEELSYILKHEQYHIQRKDYITKFVACILLGLYWFHPLVWLAYFYMTRDMEMSCDEYVVQTMGSEIKKEYSASLLAFATNNRRTSMGMLSFGESGTRKRVKHILRTKKPAKWLGVTGVVLVLITGSVCFAASDVAESFEEKIEAVEKEDEGSKEQNKKEKSDKKRPALYVSTDDAKSFIYNGKKITVESPECVSVTKVSYIDDEEIAVWGKSSSNSMYFAEYHKEYGFLFESEGYNFIWKNDDMATLVYVLGPEITYGNYEIRNHEKKTIYSSKNQICKVAFSKNDTIIVTEIETDEEGKQRKIEKEVEVGTFTVKEDLTGDGTKDEIKINVSSEVINGYVKNEENVIKVISGATGKLVYSMGNGDINLIHPGFRSLYLYHGENQNYLLSWDPCMYQGHAVYKYEIFAINDLGQKNVIENGEFSFDISNMKKESDVQKYKDFIEKVNKRLEKSDLLISTLDGELITYKSSDDHILLFDSSSDLEWMRETE